MSRAILAHIASRLLNVPLMITPQKLEVILQVLGPRIGVGDAIQPVAITDFSRRPQYREYTGDGIGLIPVMGPLAYNVSFEEAMCSDIVSYRDIRRMFREALDDPRIESILFAFDTPGGEVAGVFDLSDEIYRARGVKPIFAAADEGAFSAGYALMSAAGKIFIPRTGMVGSIGVIAQHVDQSSRDAKDGYKVTPVFAGARKNDFSPHQPLSTEALERLQALVDADYEVFVETVARNRGMSPDAVRSTEAGVFQGEGAISAGLADHVMNFDEAVRYIESQTRQGGSTMRIFGRKAKVAPAASTTEGPEATGPQEGGDVIELDALLEQAREEGRKQGREEAAKENGLDAVRAAEAARVAAIRDKVSAVKSLLPEGFANVLIEEGLSADAAGDRIIRAIAEKSAKEAPEVSSTVSPTGTGAVNPLVADAKRRADEAAKRKER